MRQANDLAWSLLAGGVVWAIAVYPWWPFDLKGNLRDGWKNE